LENVLGKFGKPVLCIKRHGFPHYYLQEEAFGKLEATGTDMLTIDDVLDDEEPANEAGNIIDLSDLSEESELIVDMTNNDVTDDVSFAARDTCTYRTSSIVCHKSRSIRRSKALKKLYLPTLPALARERCAVACRQVEGEKKERLSAKK
jgi:hypothetical protein